MYVPKGQSKIMMLIAQDAIGQNFISQPFSDFIITNQQDSSCFDPAPNDIFSEPHSNSFVDLDGDCMPDIFLQK